MSGRKCIRPGARAGLDIKNPCVGRFLRRKNTVTI
jgi:hypothetical protein